MTWTGAANTPAFTGSTYTLTVSGGVTFISGMTFSGWTTGTITFANVAGTNYLDAGGNSSIGVPITVNDAAGTVALNNNNYISSTTFTLTAGAFNLNGLNLTTTGTFTSAAAGKLTIGSSTLNCGVWTATAGEILSMSGGTINVTGASGTFATGSLAAYGTVDFQGAAATITGSGTFVNLNLVDPNATQTIQFTAGTTQTVSGTFAATGYSTSTRCVFKSSSTTKATISAAAVAVTKANISYIIGTGARSWNFDTLDVLQATASSCTGIQFSLYWVGNSATWGIGYFSSISGGTANAVSLPDSTTNVYFDSGSFSGVSQSCTLGAAQTCDNMTWIGATYSPTFALASYAINIYGNLTFISAMATSGTGAITFKGTSGTQNINTGGLTLVQPVTFNGSGGTFQLVTNNLNNTATITLTAGTFNTNSLNVTTTGTFTSGANGIVNITNSTITCGTWTANASETLTSTGSTITMTGATTFGGAGLTYNTVNLNGSGTIIISGGNTFNNLTLLATVTQTVKFTDGLSQTVTSCSLSGSVGHVHTLTGTGATGWTINGPAITIPMSNPRSVYVVGNLAYVVGYVSASLAIINVSNPASPALVGYIEGAGAPNYLSYPVSVFVSGNYAYVAAQGDNSITIIDVTNPSAPTFVGNITGTGNYISNPSSVYVVGNYAYVPTYVGGTALTIIDVTNPAAPSVKGTVTVSGYTGNPTSVFVSGNYAYLTSSPDNALIIIDVTNPSAPILAGALSGSGAPNYINNPQQVCVSGNYAYITNYNDGYLVIIDVTNPTSPTFKSRINGSMWCAQAVCVAGNYAYVTDSSSSSLNIFDISNPAVPVAKGVISGTGPPNYLFEGFSVFVSGNYAYVCAFNDLSLTIINVANPSAPTFAGNILSTSAATTFVVTYCTISYSQASPSNEFHYDSHCTYNGNYGWSPAATASITNSPSSLNFGTVMPSTTYYANGTTYSNPVTSGQCTFTITNTGSSSCNITMSCTNATGGNTWTLVSGTPSGDQFKVIAVYSGQNPASGLVLTTSNQSFYPNLPASGTLPWDFEEILGGTGSGKTGTFSDSSTKTYIITITAQ
jgi:hypothetical protein